MRLKVLACKVLFRELSLLAAHCKNFIDISYIRQGLHDEPKKLREVLQGEIDKIDAGEDYHTFKSYDNEDFDAVLIGYGLCSNGTAGLFSKKYPLIIPRAHDCITLFLGSKEKYREYLDTHRGVYWYTSGWIDNTPMPGKERYEKIRSIYTDKYGEENADYLMEMEQGWLKEYAWCSIVNWKDFDNNKAKAYTKECAKYLGWNYDELEGDKTLLTDFLKGNWDNQRFLIVPPGKKIEPSFDLDVVKDT